MKDKKDRICPVERADSLDNRLRRWIQNPRRILRPYISEGMTVLDFGCGPGYFTVDIAQMVGPGGHVIAADLQEGMLQKLEGKIKGTDLENNIVLHKCAEDKIGISEQVDFVLTFYVLHELPDQAAYFKEIASILKPGGRVFIVEPPFHVSKSDFLKINNLARENGFIPEKGPGIFLNKTLMLKKPL
jgi:ubiquinone/menaquinone biosynthesis C-methylase UbiE